VCFWCIFLIWDKLLDKLGVLINVHSAMSTTSHPFVSIWCSRLLREATDQFLWPPHAIGQAIIFLPCGFFLYLSFFFFLAECQPSQIGCLPYFHTCCGLCANLRCRSETCCTQLAVKYRTQKSRQKLPSGHHHTTLLGYIFATKAHTTVRKKLVKQQYVLQMSPHYGELRLTSG